MKDAEPVLEVAKPNEESAEPAKDAAEPVKDAVELANDATEPEKEKEPEKPMSLGAHLVALWNKVAAELSATNLTPGEILDGARFLLSLPPVNLGEGIGSVKDGIFE
jgi:hypothetical protein